MSTEQRKLSFQERLEGVLAGAALGAELGLCRTVHPEWRAAASPRDVRRIRPRPPGRLRETPGRMLRGSAWPLLDLGFRACLKTRGRPTPENFAVLLRDDPAIAVPDYAYDGLHSTQEVLKEGMPPRIAGMGNAPCGLICAAMPAVGLVHAADPARAYLEGVELASVTQPRLGADWAGLCAAAVAAAFEPDATVSTLTDRVKAIAHQHHPDLFYELDVVLRQASGPGRRRPDGLIAWWLATGCKADQDYRQNWVAYNPIRYVLPLLSGLSTDAPLLLTTLLAGQPGGMTGGYQGHLAAAVIAGAIAGALGGPGAFPAPWRRWVRRRIAPWTALTNAIDQLARQERRTLRVIEVLSATPVTDGVSRLHDKILGNILAGAIGNAMGSPVEGRFYHEIDARYPGGVTTILEPARLESEDDNQMAMLLTETYLERGGAPVMARHFGKTWLDRLNRQHFFPLCMGNAYDRIRGGVDPRIAGHWSVVTGSTVMCMEPVGLYHLNDPVGAMRDATAISTMYQRGLDVQAAAGMAAAVAAAMRPDAGVDSVLAAALAAAPRQRLRCFDQRPFRSFRDYIETCLEVAGRYDDVLAARRELYEKCLLYHMIDPMELWGFALAMFKIAGGDVRQAAIGGTNIGRDSDTIAGRAAMLAGTLRGAGAIPAEWIRLFRPAVLDKIRRNAARFAELIAGPRRDHLARRQAVMRSS